MEIPSFNNLNCEKSLKQSICSRSAANKVLIQHHFTPQTYFLSRLSYLIIKLNTMIKKQNYENQESFQISYNIHKGKKISIP